MSREQETGGAVLGYAGRDGRRRVTSGGPWEARYGYSRAIVAGDACFVAGTTDAGPDGTARHPGARRPGRRDPRASSRRPSRRPASPCSTSSGPGCTSSHAADIPAVAEAHGRWLGDVRPAATLVVVARLMDPSLLVEIEAEARRR